MRIKTNKRGFTLIELLAVIVVLAIIMIIAIPNVLDAMNTAQKKSFQMQGEKILKDAMTVYESEFLLGQRPSKKYTDGNYCYTFDDINFSAGGTYDGFVTVNVTGGNTVTYYLYLTDGVYAYNGTSYDDVMNDVKSISVEDEDINAIPESVDSVCKS